MTAPSPQTLDPRAAALSRAQRLAEALAATLQPDHLQVLDESAAHAGHVGAGPHAAGTHLRVRIGMNHWPVPSRLARHRLVYDAASAFIDEGLHALAIEIVSPHAAPVNH